MLAAILVGIAGLAVLAVAVISSRGSTSSTKFGGLPAFLPKSSITPDSTLTGSIGRMALTTQGDTVKVVLPHGTVLVTVSGPVVPGEGLPYQARATTCTWTVTFAHATTAVPVSLDQFDTIDHGGVVYHPNFVTGTPTPPTVLQAGQRTTFELRAVMVTGEGLMRWAPDGNNIEGEWDFEVEND